MADDDSRESSTDEEEENDDIQRRLRQDKFDFRIQFAIILEDKYRTKEVFKRCEPQLKQHKTVLHSLIDYLKTEQITSRHDVKKFEEFIQLLLSHDCELLKELDRQGNTPLLAALREDMDYFCRYLFKSASNSEQIKEAIRSTLSIPAKGSKTTCLHAAIECRSKFQTLKSLIEYSDKETLQMVDLDGCTPLHLAVNHKYFQFERKVEDAPNELVRKLACKCPEALNIPDANNKYPYQLVRQYYDEVLASRSSKRQFAEHNGMVQTPKPTSSSRENEVDTRRVKLKERKSYFREDKEDKKEEDGDKETDIEEDIKKMKKADRDKLLREKSMHNGMKRGDSAKADELDPSSKAVHPANTRVALAPAKESSLTHENDDLSRNEEKIKCYIEMEQLLKKTILQRYSGTEARQILYGSCSAGDHLDFNLLGVKGTLDVDTIKKRYSFLRFSEVLQFVALPRISSHQSQRDFAKPVRTNSHLEKRNSSYNTIFKWLRERKVSSILQIIIEDDLEDPHSDEDIVEALSNINGSDIELWNWRKYDIDSETILTAAPNVRELVLYTTGNGAVLRGWSDLDGLRRLKRLERVVLYVKGRAGSATRTEISEEAKKNIQMFTNRLRSLKKVDLYGDTVDTVKLIKAIHPPLGDALQKVQDPDILKNPDLMKKLLKEIRDSFAHTPVMDYSSLIDSAAYAITSEESRETRGVLDIEWNPLHLSQPLTDDLMIKFTQKDHRKAHDWVKCAEECATWVANRIERRTQSCKPIRIALIDDGVDLHPAELKVEIKDGRSYSRLYRDRRHMSSSYYSSTTGHGTLMALLMQHVCPPKYIALYIARLDDSGPGGHFTALSAAQAIDWAVEMKVDIISMSWTIDKEDQKLGLDTTNKLEKAVDNAAKNNILMFCAARDEGIEKATHTPYPAAATNKIFKIGAARPSGVQAETVNARAVDYLCPGAELRESVPRLKLPELSSLDGSSSATALAAGITALILLILSLDTGNRWDGTMSRYEKIRNILNYCSQDNDKYLRIQDIFSKYISWDEDDEIMQREPLQEMIQFLCGLHHDLMGVT